MCIISLVFARIYVRRTLYMREWLSGGAPPCQGGGRGFDPRLALFYFIRKSVFIWLPFLFVLNFFKDKLLINIALYT